MLLALAQRHVQLVLAQKLGHLLTKQTLVKLGGIVKLGELFASAWIENGYERIGGYVIIMYELLALGGVKVDLNEYEIGAYDLFHCVIAPQVSIETLTAKVGLVLYIQQYPLVLSTSFRFGLLK